MIHFKEQAMCEFMEGFVQFFQIIIEAPGAFAELAPHLDWWRLAGYLSAGVATYFVVLFLVCLPLDLRYLFRKWRGDFEPIKPEVVKVLELLSKTEYWVINCSVSVYTPDRFAEGKVRADIYGNVHVADKSGWFGDRDRISVDWSAKDKKRIGAAVTKLRLELNRREIEKNTREGAARLMELSPKQPSPVA